ncbi:MAG TPA: 50S ribosomal protein L1 [bacterium]|nr:50S ribosomal protein L1 [bacterium]
MANYGKRMKDAMNNFDRNVKYSIKESVAILQKSASKKFDETVEVAVNLGINAKKSDQMVRGATVFPHGVGKTSKVCAVVPADMVELAKNAGADYYGSEELIEKIMTEEWTDFDKLVTTPAMMGKIGKLGKVLGRKGLMPNPKLGTVNNDISAAIKLVKAGRVEFKTNKAGVLCCMVGKLSFGPDKISDNVMELMKDLIKLKPATAKGTFIKKITISSTMGPGVKLDETAIVSEAK